MTPLDAVAAAIRERLLAGQPAPLLGLGTLVRQHVSARVQERADGTRMMLPPGETIGLGPSTANEPSLALPFARLRALPPDAAEAAYAGAMDQIEALLAATGEVRLPGVGLLRRTSSGVVLGVEAELLAAVNRTYEGLAPVTTSAPSAAAPAPPVEPPAPAAEAEPDVPTAAPSSYHRLPPIEVIPSAEDEPSLRDEPTDLNGPAGEAVAAPWVDEVDADPFAGDDPFARDEDAVADDEDAVGAGPVDTPPVEPPIDVAWDANPDEDETPPTEADPEPDAPSAQPDASAEPPSDPARLGDEAGGADAPTEAEPPPILAPFGAPDAPPLADGFPPTEPAPALADAWESELDFASPPSPDDEWERETWTAPALGDAPSFDAPLATDGEAVDAVIEDADFDIVSPQAVAPVEELSGLLSEPPTPPADEPPILTVPPPPVIADAPGGLTPRLVAQPVETAVEAPARTVAARTPDEAPQRRWWLWAVLLLLLAALVLAAVWFWPEIRSRVRLLSSPNETITVDAAPTAPLRIDDEAPRREPAAQTVPDAASVADGTLETQDGGGQPPDDETRALGASPTRAPASTRPAARRSTDDDTPAPPTGLGQAPAPGVALLPPRVSGLSPADVRAIAARDEPIDPTADAWTFVVLSTTSRDDADALHDRYRRAGYRTSVLTSRGGQYRVCIGQFPSRDDAVRLRNRLPPQAPGDTWALYLKTL